MYFFVQNGMFPFYLYFHSDMLLLLISIQELKENWKTWKIILFIISEYLLNYILMLNFKILLVWKY